MTDSVTRIESGESARGRESTRPALAERVRRPYDPLAMNDAHTVTALDTRKLLCFAAFASATLSVDWAMTRTAA